MSREAFNEIMGRVAAAIGDKPLEEALARFLNETFPADGEDFTAVEALCRKGEAEGWICNREGGGIKFSRPVKPGAEAGPFSVDVVRMPSMKGPHHVHPLGEIGMIMPIEGEAAFDGSPRGWYVYGPGTAHWPTVSKGEAYVLYLLPEGRIEFTGK
jgi:hypothetical protein